jgi:beta-phosphoglucomutase family hydrolase
MRPPRLLIADVDTALFGDGHGPSPRTLKAAAQLHASGVRLGLVSDRPPRGLGRLIQALGIDAPVAAFGGGMIVRPDLSEVLDARTLALIVADEVLACIEEHDLQAWVYRGLDWFVADAGTPAVAREREVVAFDPTCIPDLRRVLDGVVEIVGIGDKPEAVARCEAELRTRLGVYGCAARTGERVEVRHPDANQAQVVRICAESLSIPIEQIAVLGGTAADVLMFGLAGLSIATGDATAEVRRAARHVTAASAEEGFAEAVDRFLLPPRDGDTLLLPPHLRACLFDMDGVLTQTSRLHSTAWKRIFDEYLRARSARIGAPFAPFDPLTDYARYVDGKLRIDGARTFLSSRQIDASDVEVAELARRKDEAFVALIRTQPVELYEGSVRFVRAARRAALGTAVVSASRHCQEVLASAGILDLFDTVVDGRVADAEQLKGKPAPDTFLTAAATLGVDALHAAVFEDALSGVAAGHAGRFGFVIGVDRLGHAADLKRHGADVVVGDLAALLEGP